MASWNGAWRRPEVRRWTAHSGRRRKARSGGAPAWGRRPRRATRRGGRDGVGVVEFCSRERRQEANGVAATDGDLRAWTHASMRLRKNSNEGMGRCVRARGNEGNKNCDGGSPSWPETEKNGGGRTNSGEKIRRPGGDTERAFGGRRKRRFVTSQIYNKN